MPSVLVLQSDPFDPPALIGERLALSGIDMVVRRTDQGECPRDGDLGPDGLLIMGGPQSLLDVKHATMFEGMCDVVRRFHGSGRPVLGVCLGAQVIAKAFGADIHRADELQFGFLPVHLRPEALLDPVLQDQERDNRIFCWHEDRFEVPEGAVVLAETEQIPDYGFRLGRLTYGFQCHFEFTRETLDRVITRGGHLVPKNLGRRGAELLERLPEAIARHLPAANRFGAGVSDRWADLVMETSRARRKTADRADVS